VKNLDLIIIGAVLIGAFLAWQFMGGRMSNKQIKRRIDRIQQRRIGPTAGSQTMLSLKRKMVDEHGLANWLMSPLPDFKKLGDHLARAGKTMTPKQFIFRRAMYFLGITLVIAVVLKKNIFLALAVALVFGVWGPFKLLDRAITKQGKAFLRVFPDAIDLIVRGLRSGLPVSESLVVVSTEIPDPVGTIFKGIADTMKLGVPMEKALTETAKKLHLTEFNFFITSIILQKETGGNLGEILNNLSEVLRGRYIMQMKIKAMSSEARASAYIIGALPFVVIAAVGVLSPDYMKPLWNDYRGNICAGIAAGMMMFGGWIMNRMIKFEI
jgi:tight adherence protein B